MPIAEYTGKGESILVIDDVEQQREAAVEILRQLRYSVNSVPSGEEAVKYLRKRTVDLILLDMIEELSKLNPRCRKPDGF